MAHGDVSCSKPSGLKIIIQISETKHDENALSFYEWFMSLGRASALIAFGEDHRGVTDDGRASGLGYASALNELIDP